MNKCLTILALILCTAGVPAAAQHVEVQVNAGALDLQAAGWTEVEEGVWERVSERGFLERFAVGPAAPHLALADYRATLPGLVDAYLQDLRPDLGEAIDKLLDSIAAAERAVAEQGRPGLGRRQQAVSACDITVSVSADAFGTGCGTRADAAVSYSNSCNQECYINSYTYAQARNCDGALNSSTDACSNNGVNISCSSSTSEGGATDCYSYASASIYCDVLGSTSPYYLSTDDTNNTCCGQFLCCACPRPL